MTWFEHWRRWAPSLQDGPFARAWFALGVYEAARLKRGGQRERELLQHESLYPAPRRAHVLDVINRAVATAARERSPLAWSFPVPPGKAPTDGNALAELLSPQAWVEVAETLIDRLATHKGTLKVLRVAYPPEAEPAAPWALALRAAALGLAVSLRVAAPKAQLYLGWPLRLGTFGGAAAKAVEAALNFWPSNKLARAVSLGREQANCDVLVHVGGSADLVTLLVTQPVRIKADLVLLVAGHPTDEEALDERKRLLMAETAAGGIALVPWTGMEDLVPALNELVRQVTHAETLDVAVHSAFFAGLGPSLVWMSDELAGLSVRDVADRLDGRLKSMPRGTSIDLSRLRPDLVQSAPPDPLPAPLPPQAPLTVPPRVGRGRGVQVEPSSPLAPPPRAPSVIPPLPTPGMAAELPVARRPEFELRTEAMVFDKESHGASDLLDVAEAVDGAQEPAATQVSRAARHLQQRSSVVLDDGAEQPALGGFVLGAKALVVLRVGTPGQGWQSLDAPFPVEKLPPNEDRYRLTLWLTEPTQLAAPLRGEISLPRDGDSTECTLEFAPREAGRFDGRVSVLHRGRVLQTAAFRARVISPKDADLLGLAGEADGSPRLEELAAVRHKLSELEARRQFDCAFVTNHTATGQPRLVALSDKRAWIVDTAGAQDSMAEINAELSKVAHRVADYKDGLDSPDGLKALIKLAQCGAYLRIFLVDEQLDRQGTHGAIAREEFIQVVSLRSDATIPFEFIYDPDPPDDTAQVCPHWRSAVQSGACATDCPGESTSRVCPMGFWGLSKVIERHHIAPELDGGGKGLFLQSEPSRSSPPLAVRGPVLLASSHRVSEASLKAVETKLGACPGVKVLSVGSWDEWKSAVEQNNPGFILSMPHTDGKGASVSLEISKKTLKTILITSKHVCPTPQSMSPLVALLGCDTTTSAETYTRHVAVFRAKGAAVVIGTIATVFGDHAAAVAELLADELLKPRTAPFRLGEVIRDIKRRCLLDKQMMPLCVVAYGDADWRIAN